MQIRKFLIGLAIGVITASAAYADPNDNKLVIEGETITTDAPAPKGSALSRIYSGWRFRNSETQALQSDDFENPAFVFVDQGKEQWSKVDGKAGKSCASCHAKAAESMKGVRAQYPKWSKKLNKPHTLETQINECRTDRMQADKWKWEAPNMLAMTAYIGLQSRGMPVAVNVNAGDMKKWHAKGKDLYYTRVGQLNMSCANCHESNYGNMIRADHLSQGQINGFPVYRLKWGGLGSIHRRFKGCMKNIRAKPYKRGSDEFIALETYLATRGKGLDIETPSVRN